MKASDRLFDDKSLIVYFVSACVVDVFYASDPCFVRRGERFFLRAFGLCERPVNQTGVVVSGDFSAREIVDPFRSENVFHGGLRPIKYSDPVRKTKYFGRKTVRYTCIRRCENV